VLDATVVLVSGAAKFWGLVSIGGVRPGTDWRTWDVERKYGETRVGQDVDGAVPDETVLMVLSAQRERCRSEVKRKDGETRMGSDVDGAVPDRVSMRASFSASKRRMPYFTEASIWPSAPLAAVVATQWTLAHGD